MLKECNTPIHPRFIPAFTTEAETLLLSSYMNPWLHLVCVSMFFPENLQSTSRENREKMMITLSAMWTMLLLEEGKVELRTPVRGEL